MSVRVLRCVTGKDYKNISRNETTNIRLVREILKYTWCLFGLQIKILTIDVQWNIFWTEFKTKYYLSEQSGCCVPYNEVSWAGNADELTAGGEAASVSVHRVLLCV